MKLTKSLFLAFAGLGLFACSNEDVADNGGIQGDANVVVRINTDASRALDNAFSQSGALKVTGKAVVYLETATGTQSREIDLSETERTATFTGVRSPGHIWVSVNKYNETGGEAPAITLTMANGENNKGLNAPMFADGGNVSSTWQSSEVEGVTTYTGTLAPEHKVARLEFGGIKHVKTPDVPSGYKACVFKTITFDGLFLNNIKESTTASASSFSTWQAVTSQSNMPCFDAISENGADFVKDGEDVVTYPASGCYAYNIIGDDAPVLTLCFSNISLVDTDSYWANLDAKGYATVATYKAKGSDIKDAADKFGVTAEPIENDTYYEITKFPAGYIYQVKDLSIKDENIGTTIDGKPVNVVATVTIADWQLVSGEVVWN